MTTPTTPTTPGKRPHPREKITARALVVWSAAVLVYVAAIASRTSFGVAGIAAIDRFHIDASRIAVFTAVQVGTYAFAQIPTGLLIDRFGPRRLLVCGAVIMGIGQLTLGVTPNYWVAIAARVLIGAGDATAFLSVMRLLPYWFPMKHAPIFSQLSASLGQLGQFISAVPFLALLGAKGWVVSFVSLGSAMLVVALAAGIAVADTPDPVTEKHRKQEGPKTPLRRRLATTLRHPAGWQAFFIHFSSMAPEAVFCLLWGVPLMTLGMGLSPAQAGMALTINTLVIISAGPVFGFISARTGRNRDVIVILIATISVIAWIVFFLPGAPRGLAAAIVINVFLGLCTPVSNYGFDYVREKMPRDSVATGTGVGNMGGFIATMIAAQIMGLVLDHTSGGTGAYDWADFRAGWIVLIVVMLIGIAGVIASGLAMRRASRRQASPDGDYDVQIVSEEEAR